MPEASVMDPGQPLLRVAGAGGIRVSAEADELCADVSYEKPLTAAKLVKFVRPFLEQAEKYLPAAE